MCLKQKPFWNADSIKELGQLRSIREKPWAWENNRLAERKLPLAQSLPRGLIVHLFRRRGSANIAILYCFHDNSEWNIKVAT